MSLQLLIQLKNNITELKKCWLPPWYQKALTCIQVTWSTQELFSLYSASQESINTVRGDSSTTQKERSTTTKQY